MKKIIYLLGMVTILCIVACSDDFTTNEDETLQGIDAFFADESNVEEALIGVYDLMQHNYNGVWSNPFFMKTLPGDANNCGGAFQGDQVNYEEIDEYRIDSGNGAVTTTWNQFYKTIALVNVIVSELEDSSLSNKDRVLAEAKFFRAWCYFELTTLFGEVPLILKLSSNVEDFSNPKSSQEEIYTQIKLDLADAIAGLPNKSALSDNFRVSNGAANALMGKVLVFQELYSESIPYFEEVINNGAHDLESNVADVWTESSEFGIESLVEIGYISTGEITWDNIPWGGRMESNLHIQLMGPRGEGVFELGSTGVVNGWGFNYPTAKLVEAFDANGDVVRKAATVITEAEIIAAGGSVNPTVAQNGFIFGYENVIRRKYAPTSEDTGAGQPELNYTTNYRLFRYAEVLLLAAEAYNKAGQDGNARIELNKIRQRAGLADIDASLSGDALFDAIVNEKYLELAHEGQRFWDLVRWGRASEELGANGYTSKSDLFPIPISEIEKNPSLTIEDQNPGY